MMEKGKSAQINSRGTTLIELLTSMALLSVIILVLSLALELSMRQFRGGVDRSENVVATQASLDWIQNDLKSVVTDRYANLAPLPDSVTEEQREFFEGRLFQLIEINRETGEGMPEPRTFQNAYPGFGSMAFVARLPIDAQFSVSYDRSRRSETPASVTEEAVSWEAMARASLVGYYVAYTYDSPFAGERRGSMRLHRHYRSGDSLLTQGYSSGFLIAVSNVVNDAYDEYGSGARDLNEANPAKVRQGKFSNDQLPYIFSRFTGDSQNFNGGTATQPWPRYPVPALLTSPPPTLNPPRGSPSDWDDPQNEVHDTVFPDEPIAHNVVRFEIEPYRRVEVSKGKFETMGAAALNQYLSLPGEDDWPALVRPDFVDITLATIKETAARQLESPGDWIVDWTETNSDNWTPLRKLIEANLHVFHVRIHLNSVAR